MSQPLPIGRFDKSFIVKMVRDFFISVLVLALLQVGFGLLMTINQFMQEGSSTARNAAEKLAADVKSIMLNRGGPVAARTVYPILQHNYQQLRLEIAIVPSEVTVTSIEGRFDFEPKGVPEEWPQGDRYQEHTVALTAEPFCLQCHVLAAVGDELGHVVVRNYFTSYIDRWWENVRLTSLVSMVDIIASIIILYFLLKIRMEPLLALRSALSRLARGTMDLTRRATVKSDDEFGELAQDLNAFLDHICRLVEDLNRILTRETEVHQRLSLALGRTDEQLEKMQSEVRDCIRYIIGSTQSLPPPEALKNALEELSADMGALGESEAIRAEQQQRLLQVLRDYRDGVNQAWEIFRRYEPLGQEVLAIDRDNRQLLHLISELTALQTEMDIITESGQHLLDRLSVH